MDTLIKCRLTVETGALIFAICNLVVTSAASIAGTGLMIFALCNMARQQFDLDMILRDYMWIFFFSLCAAISLLFAVVLQLGILRRNKLYLKIYLIYGMVVIGLLLFFVIVYAAIVKDPVLTFITCLLIVLYSFIIYVICETYIHYGDNPSNDERPPQNIKKMMEEIFRSTVDSLSQTISGFFGAKNLIMTVLSSILSGCLMIYGILAIESQITNQSSYGDFNDKVFMISSYGFTVVVIFYSSVTALLLFSGLQKKKAIYLKAYCINGGVVEVSSVIFTILYLGFDFDHHQKSLYFFMFICGLYAFILYLIYKTAQNYNTIQELDDIVNNEEEPEDSKTNNFEQNILLQNEMMKEKSIEDDLPKTEEV